MQEDYTGIAPSHKITDELVPMSTVINNTFPLAMGAFFEESVIIKNQATGQALVPDRDYRYRVLDSALSGHTGGKRIYYLVELKTNQVNNLLVTYQYVGGIAVEQRNTIINLLTNLGDTDLRDIYFSHIKNRPHTFSVTEDHFHDVGDVYGKDEEIAVLGEIATALDLMGRNLVEGPESELAAYVYANINSLNKAGLGRTKAIIKNQTMLIEQMRVSMEMHDRLRKLENANE